MVDVDHSGEIDFSEFVTATVNRNNLLQEDKLKLAFQYYDTDNSGEITVEEIKDALGVGKGNIDEHVWKQVAQEVDVNGDGLISYEEFKEMYNDHITGKIDPSLRTAGRPDTAFDDGVSQSRGKTGMSNNVLDAE